MIIEKDDSDKSKRLDERLISASDDSLAAGNPLWGRTVMRGRRIGRPLSPTKKSDIKELKDDYYISPEGDQMELEQLFDQPKSQMFFEIGFGAGEHLIGLAAKHPEDGFIGCEPFINGYLKAMRGARDQELLNVKLNDGDGLAVLKRVPDYSLDGIYVLFPDPWPKSRHNKRRIISMKNIDLFAQKLKPKGFLQLASDHRDYVCWMLRHMKARSDFMWNASSAEDWDNPPKDWITTRYEQKALLEGIKCIYMTYQKMA